MNWMRNLDSGETRSRNSRTGNAIALTLMFTLGLLTASCSGGGLFGRSDTRGAANSSPSIGDRISNIFGNKPAQPQVQSQDPNSAAITAEDIECPGVQIREGTSTFSVSAAGADPSVMSLRYQATFGQTARECKVSGTTLTIRVGVEGRIILGPAGGPGQMEIPLRYAVVSEGSEPKTITTKLRWFTVVIPPGETNVAYTVVEEDLSFLLPRERELDAYVVYIGFDRSAVKGPEKKTPAKKPPPASKRKT